MASHGEFSINIKYENLIHDAEEVLKTLTPKAIEVQDKDDKYFYVRILPYRTLSNAIDGIIITFSDITDYKTIERELQEKYSVLNDSLLFTRCVLDSLALPVLVVDEKLNILSTSRAFDEMFNLGHKEILGKTLYSFFKEKWRLPLLIDGIEEMFKEEIYKKQIVIDDVTPKLGCKKLIFNACRIFNESLDTNTILLTMEKE